MKRYTFAQYATALWLPGAVLGLTLYALSLPTKLFAWVAYTTMTAAADHGAWAVIALGIAVCAGAYACVVTLIVFAQLLVEYVYDSPPIWRGGFARATPAARSYTPSARGYTRQARPQARPQPQARSTGSPVRYATAAAGTGVAAAAAGTAWGGVDDMHDPMSAHFQAQQLAQMQEPVRMFPGVNPTTGATMTADSPIDDTGHIYCDPTPVYDYTPAYDCGSSSCGGFDF